MVLSAALGLFGLVGLAVAKEDYAEKLQIQPLTRNEVLSTFTFEMSQPIPSNDDWDLHEYTTFPRSLGQIVEQSGTKELHLRFGQGWWDSESWGSPPLNGARSGGIGVEVWAWVSGDDLEEAWKNWRRLVHSLGGYFCASINFIDETQTTFPSDALFTPQSSNLGGNTYLMRGALPAEPICTENLTPFLKLLPCQGKAGIASLLDGHSLFRSLWQTMSVDIWRSGENTLNLEQTVANVVNVDLAKRDDPQPFAIPHDELVCDQSKPWANDWTCFPVNPTSTNFTLSQLFGHKIRGSCPLASSENLRVEVLAPSNWLVNGSPDTRIYLLDDSFAEDLDLEIRTDDASSFHDTAHPPLFVERSFSGWGQQNGGIRTVFTNSEKEVLRVSYLETLPWFMRLYLHTTQASGQGRITHTEYSPSKDRTKPGQLELTIELEPQGKLEIEYMFDKSLLYIEEYPPDANHGFEVPPGLAVILTPEGKHEARTSSLLLSLPVPDFSMPYNVIILTSTVMALMFGTMFNLIARDVVSESEVAPQAAAPIASLKNKLIGRLRRR